MQTSLNKTTSTFNPHFQFKLYKLIRYVLPLFAGATFFLGACKEEPPKINKASSVQVNLNIKVDNLPLLFDSILYTNAAGNQYSATTLHFYLSGFSFQNKNGSSIGSSHVQYVDGQNALTQNFVLTDIDQGSYSGVSFYLGLDSTINKTNALPAILDNLNMAWPDPMGGGYHFMKFEGHYLDSVNNKIGYAMHLGKNEYLIKVNLSKEFEIGDNAFPLNLTMNMNEMFVNPYIFNLVTEPKNTMTSPDAMNKISKNAANAFKIN